MKEILELIIILLFCGGLLFLTLSFFSWVIITPICDYYINKKSNKIQWCCKKMEDLDTCDEYFLCYRILPSELNKFVKIFGLNGWQEVYRFAGTKFKDKNEFIDFVKRFETVEDIENFIKEKENIWIYP